MRLVRISVKIQVYIVIVYSCVVHMVAHFGFSRVKLRKCGVLPSQVLPPVFFLFLSSTLLGCSPFPDPVNAGLLCATRCPFLVIVVVFMSSLSP